MVCVARGMLNGAIGIVAGAREIARMQFVSTTQYDRDVLVFVGIASESDHLPLGEIRQQWAPEALRVKDEELQSYEARVRERAFRACEGLIARYSHYEDVG